MMDPSPRPSGGAPARNYEPDRWPHRRETWTAGLMLLIGLLAVQPVCGQSVHADAIVGTWHTERGGMHICITPCEGNAYCGRIVKLDEAPERGQPLRDTNNPNATLRDRPLKGLRVLTDLTYDGDARWAGGSMYAPQRGKHVNIEFQMLHPDTLRARVSKFIFSKTMHWTREESRK